MPTDKAVFALRAALWELDRLVEKGMSPDDFEATRSFLLNYSKLWVQTLSRRLGYAIDGEFYGRKDLVTELAERLPRLTVEQVNAAVRKHLKTRRHEGRHRRPERRRASRDPDLRQAVAHRPTTPRAPPRTSWPRTSRSPSSRSRMSRSRSCRWSRCLRSSRRVAQWQWQ